MATHISGAVLASLIYDQKKNHGDQEGLLLGEVVNHVRDTISDSQINNSQIETKIYIYSCVPCLRSQRFYDGSCRVIPSQLQNLLSDKQKDVIGWYRFRHNSTMRISMREKAVHQNLARFCRQSEVKGDNFLFLLCATNLSSNWSTHNQDFVFHRQSDNNKFDVVPVTVINLGDTTHDEYRTESCHTVPHSGAFNSMMCHFQKDFLDKSGCVEEVSKVHKMGETFSLHLQELQNHLAHSEEQLAQLEADVSCIREKVNQKRNAELVFQLQLPPEPPPPYTEISLEGKGDTLKKQPSFESIEERIQRARTARRLSSGRSLQLSSTDHEDERIDSKQKKATEEHKINLIDFSTDKLPVVTGTGSLDIEINSHQPKIDHPICTDHVQAKNELEDYDKNAVQTTSSESEEDNGGAQILRKKPGDMFAFVDSVLEEAKTQTPNTLGGESPSTMTLPVGNKIQLPVNGAEITKGDKSSTSAKSVKLTPLTRLRSNKQNAAALTAASCLGSCLKQERTRSQRSQAKQGQTRSRADDFQETDFSIIQESNTKTVQKVSNQNSDVLGNSDSCVAKSKKTEEIIDVDVQDCNRQTVSPSIFS